MHSMLCSWIEFGETIIFVKNPGGSVEGVVEVKEVVKGHFEARFQESNVVRPNLEGIEF